MNDAGQVVGWASPDAGPPRAFIWTPADGMVDLGSIAGGPSGNEARAINNAGQVVGVARPR